MICLTLIQVSRLSIKYVCLAVTFIFSLQKFEPFVRHFFWFLTFESDQLKISPELPSFLMNSYHQVY